MADQGFREIQLDAKQLVFLFMTAAVVLVVAFLCGVLVGRGVRGGDEAVSASAAPIEAVEGTPAEVPAASEPPPAAPLAPPQPAAEDAGYLERLEGQPPKGDSVSTQPEEARKREVEVSGPATPKPAAEHQPTPAAFAEPAGQGFAVQVTALSDRANAESVARRLLSKGHKAYVLTPGARGSRMYRVVVGKFKTRQEAEQAKRRLEREEQFKPWIIR